MEKEPTWQGLRTIIPAVLTLGILGYPIINAGSVGGEIVC